MSTEIVKVADALPSQEEVAGELDRLEASGDTQELHKFAGEMSAWQEYEKQQQATERANYFGRLKVMAEARIGNIDLVLHPRTRGSALQFEDHIVQDHLRRAWRKLAVGLQTGQLDRAMRQAETMHDAVGTYSVVKALLDIGVTAYVWTAPLLERYRELRESEGLTVAEVARRTGLPARNWLTGPGANPASDKAFRNIAFALAKVLGVDPVVLKPARHYRRPHNRRVPLAKPLRGGRLDETYSLIRKALQELDRAAPNGEYGTTALWEHLYAAEEIAGKSLRRADGKQKVGPEVSLRPAYPSRSTKRQQEKQ